MNKKFHELRCALSTLGLSTLLACTLHGDIIFEETFDTLNDGELNGQNGWVANTGESINVENGGLSYASGDLEINGGTKSLTFTTGDTDKTLLDFYKSIGSQSGNTTPIYWSYTLKINAVDAADRFFFGVDATGDWSTGFAGAGDATTSALQWGDRMLAQNYNDGPAYTTGQTYFVVVGLDSSGSSGSGGHYDNIQVWINPTSSIAGSATYSRDATTFTTTMTVWGFGRDNSVALDANIDNIIVGQSFSDVTSQYAVPEPGSYALLAGCMILVVGMLRTRCRKD